MNRLLLFTLLLVACKQKPVEQLPTTAEKEVVVRDTITVSDIHRTDSLWSSFWEYKRPYVKGYIINQDYVIYQEKNTRKIIKPDMASFAILNVSGSAADIILIFAKDKNGIYYQGDFIKIDTTGFRVVGFISHYDKQSDYYWEEPIWRTYKQAFRGTKPIAISDPATFESVTTCYFKDKNYLYYYDRKVEGADVATLQKELADEEFVSDKNNTYYRGKPFIYKGERVQQVSNNIYKTATHVLRYNLEYDKERVKYYFIELPDYFDIPTLRRLNDFYLIDKNHLYYDESGYPLEDKDLRVPIPKENLSKIKLFEVLVTDGNKVYRGKKPLSGYDAATFGVIPGHYYYLYDKNGVYDWDYKLPFRYTNRPEYGKNLFYMDDQDLFVYEDQAYYKTYEDSLYVPHLTPQQLALLKEGNTPLRELFPSQDDKQKNKEIDTTGFEQLSYSFSGHNPFWRHNGQIYHLIEWWYDNDQLKWRRSERRYVVVKGYDNASLRVVPNGFLADKDYWYDGTTRLFPSKDVELLAIYEGYEKGWGMDPAPSPNFYLFKNAQGYWLAELSGEGAMCPLTNEQASKLLNRQ